MLTLTLNGLEQDGLVRRTIFPTMPPRVDYELTELGRNLIVPLTALYEWAVERLIILVARDEFAKNECEAALQPPFTTRTNDARQCSLFDPEIDVIHGMDIPKLDQWRSNLWRPYGGTSCWIYFVIRSSLHFCT